MLQAAENRSARATRGAGNKKVVKTKRTPKKPRKSASKVKAVDDSDVELGSDGEIKEKPKKGGFHKQYHLSAPLAELVGEPTLSRPQVVKKIWEYIKARDLQDPADKRQIRCALQRQECTYFETGKMSLLPAETAQYTAIIDSILRKSNIETISAKQIRKQLQAALDQDISDKK